MDTNTLILIIVIIVAAVIVLLILRNRIFKGNVSAGSVSGSLEVGGVAKEDTPKSNPQSKSNNPPVQVSERGVYVGGPNTGSINTGDNNSINSGNRSANLKAKNISGSTVINAAGDVTTASPDKPSAANKKK